MKKVYKILLAITAVLVLMACAFLVYINIDTPKITGLTQLETDLQALSPTAVKVDGVKLYTQPDGFSCGVTTESVVASFLTNQDISPQSLIAKYSLKAGMTYDKFVSVLAEELPDYQVSYQHGQSDLDLLKAIHQQLKDGIPVPVFFGAANPYKQPYYDFHASVVIGVDFETQKVDVLNVYGYEEQISLVDFLNRMSYRGTKNYPLVQRMVIKLGLMDKNSVILLAKK